MTRLLNLAAFFTSIGSLGIFLTTWMTNQDPVYMMVTATVTIIYALIPILHHFYLVKTVQYYFATILPLWYTVTILCIGGFFSQSIATAATLTITYVLFNKRKRLRNGLIVHNVLLFVLPSIYLGFFPPFFGVRDYPLDEVVVFLLCGGWISLIFAHYRNQRRAFIKRLEEKNKALEATKEELERFNQIASHDLKAPLRTIVGFTGLIERNIQKGNTEQALKDLEFVKTSAKQMNVLVEDILEISRLNNNQEAQKILVDLNVLMDRVEANLLGDIIAKNAKITVGELPSYFCNEVEFLLLFQNLIQNGLKYNESLKPNVRIWVETNEKILTLNFKDNGIGIEEQYFGKIFDHFKRLHAQGEYNGTGLGLALCKKIVEKHKGQIRVASVIGKGTTFSIELPVVNQQNSHQKNLRPLSDEKGALSTEEKTKVEVELIALKAK